MGPLHPQLCGDGQHRQPTATLCNLEMMVQLPLGQLLDQKPGAVGPQDEMNWVSGSGWAPEEGRTDAQASQDQG